MRIYHPKHGILHVSDQAEIKRLLETGGEEFNVHDKPWQRKPSPLKDKEEIKLEVEQEPETAETGHLMPAPRRGRPAKYGNH